MAFYPGLSGSRAGLNGYCDNLVNRTEVTTEGCAVIVPSLGKRGCLHVSLTNSSSKGKTALLQVSCLRYFPEWKEETATRAAGAQVHRCTGAGEAKAQHRKDERRSLSAAWALSSKTARGRDQPQGCETHCSEELATWTTLQSPGSLADASALHSFL